MFNVPAICVSCGTVFPGIDIVGINKIQFFTCRAGGDCPTCGGIGVVQSGTFELVSGAVHFLAAPTYTTDQLRALESILRLSQAQRGELRTLIETVQTEAPELASFVSWMQQYLVPKNSGEVTGLISMILAAIALIISLKPQNDVPRNFTDKEVGAIVEKAVTAAITHTAAGKSTPSVDEQTALKKAIKVGRNDLCPCLSGKKYKKCCIN